METLTQTEAIIAFIAIMIGGWALIYGFNELVDRATVKLTKKKGS